MSSLLNSTSRVDPLGGNRGIADPGEDALARFNRTPLTRRLVTIARALAPIIGIIGFLAIWQLAIIVFDIPKFELSRPTDILRGLKNDPSFYIENGRTTLWEAFLGFVIALIAGLAGATLMAHSRFIERAVGPIAVILQVTPILAYAPAIVIWVGFGLKPIVIITSIVCFVPFLINGLTGLRSVDPNLLELARSVNASRREIFTRLRLPSALPHLFSAARIAVGLALIGAVLSEYFAGVSAGLGWSVKIALNRNLALQAWGSVYTLAVIGSTAVLLLGGIERVALRWHTSQRT